jgi:catechol 2,3-dioxygenase-like lactoylglutathione lyase family enzyme
MRVLRIVPDLHGGISAHSRAFYEGVLGLELVMDQGWILTFAAPGNPGAQLTLLEHDASARVNPDVSIEVDDVDSVYIEAERLGLEIVHPLTDEPWGVRRFFVREPNGKVVNILSHR